jgi:putative two-component system response regulator
MNINLAMIFTITTISNGGYLALALAKNTEQALLAQKIVYLVIIYSPLFVLFNVVSLCKINFPKILRFILTIACSGIYTLILTAGYSKLYYKSIELHTLDGITYITKEYGPTNFLYTIVTYSVTGISLGLIIYAFYHQKSVSIKNSITLLVILLIMISTFFAKKIIGTNVELMPMFYSVLVMLLFIL